MAAGMIRAAAERKANTIMPAANTIVKRRRRLEDGTRMIANTILQRHGAYDDDGEYDS
jgi:hypothetical protein